MTEESLRPASPSLVGRVLGGRYDVIRLLGRGGMGEVYEGNHRLLHKRVAIKVLGSSLAAEENQRKRFLREARSANEIDHENVVSILDFGDDEPTYFVMEFLEGEDLHALVDREGGLRWTRARPIILQICAALAAAHGRGIVHRDVKPSNCFVLRKGGRADFVKVLDFGIAKVAETNANATGLTRTHELMGTVAYMAPEQALGEEVDARTDIYALGVVIYEMLSGKVPFSGTNSYKVLDQHVRKPPPPPVFVDATIPAEVAPLILKALEKDPSDRFQSMDELAEAVARIGQIAVPQFHAAGTEFLPGSERFVPAMPPTQVLENLPGAGHGGPTEPLMVQRGQAPRAPTGAQRNERAETNPVELSAGGGRPMTAMTMSGAIDESRPRSIRNYILGGLAVLVAVGGGVFAGTQMTGGEQPAPVVPAAEPEVANATKREEPQQNAAKGPVLVEVSPAPPVPPPTTELSPAPVVEAPPVVAVLPSEDFVEVVPEAAPATPKPAAARPSSKPKPAGAKSFASIEATIRKKALSKCKDGLSGTSIEATFLVSHQGATMMVKAGGSNARTPAGSCLVDLVKAAKFSPTDEGRHSLIVSF
jgi:tRNA A-37 threonylcarbamoyl transferase component Bud32